MSRGGPAADPRPVTPEPAWRRDPWATQRVKPGPRSCSAQRTHPLPDGRASTGTASYPGNSPRAVISQTTSAPSSISPITMLAAMPAARPRSRAPCPSGRR